MTMSLGRENLIVMHVKGHLVDLHSSPQTLTIFRSRFWVRLNHLWIIHSMEKTDKIITTIDKGFKSRP